jgi:hypothetical protein
MNRFPVVLGYNTKVWTKATAPEAGSRRSIPSSRARSGVVQAAAGGSSWSVALFQRTKVDPRFWEKQAANEPRIYTSSGPMAEDIVRGEITVGTVQMGLVKNLIKAGAPISLHFPKEGAPTVASVVGVTSVARHPNAAKLSSWVAGRRRPAIADIFTDYAVIPPSRLLTCRRRNRCAAAGSAVDRGCGGSYATRDKWIPWDQIYRAGKPR